eukprot:CAMPEP_0181316230 /NCGR_PEP_ID=MMETSP1101-20121128/15786_1 /TAXON_ID=46948 /ORGANISM="Rhodomonas abbreviata, Strain Caron Lab Isolate" /LENGTH=314 /DNA_ID=CAMNT_0023423467 /DNA_START=6 /DNA_END=950 /DNA_ORIENTATION=+
MAPTRRVTSHAMVALAAAVLGIAAIACVFVATIDTTSNRAELLYTSQGNWGGFLAGRGEYPHRGRSANHLSKADLQLLKIAGQEEKKEHKDGLKAEKADKEALKAREAKKAALAAKKAKAAKEQPAAKQQLPAPYLKPEPAKKPGSLTHKDKQLLKIAEKEMHKENVKAVKTKKEDQLAEAERNAQKEAKKKALAKEKAEEAKKDTDPSSWGGWLGVLSKKKAKADDLDPKALQLLKAAYADQRNDMTVGEEAKARDDASYQQMYMLRKGQLHGKAKREALAELNHITQKASIGLNHATYMDDSELAHSWVHSY